MGYFVMEYSKETRDELVKNRESLLKQLERLQREIQALDVVLKMGRNEEEPRQLPLPTPPPSGFPISAQDLRGMKQKPALRVIARAQSGILRTGEAKDLMIAAKIMRDTKNAYKMVYNLIRNMEEFQPTDNRGEYRLTEAVRPASVQ